MKNKIKIGDNEFVAKSHALAYYKAILNKYSFGESLDDEDFDKILDLINYAWFDDDKFLFEEAIDVTNEEQVDLVLVDVKVSKVQFNTRCFEIFYDDETSQYISYILLVNKRSYTNEELYTSACRNVVYEDINKVKHSYFKANSINGLVLCQETGIASKWEELVVDHRQPNTFSVILDRFKEIHGLDLAGIKYTSASNNMIIFKDVDLGQKFRDYHRDKANLRIVRKECNAARASMAHARRKKKDLTIKKPEQLSLF